MLTLRTPPLLAWLALLCLSSSSSIVRADDDYQEVVDEGVREFGAGNFVEARALFEHAHALRPSARTLRALGFCAFELKHYVQAEDELDAALADTRNQLNEAQRDEVSATAAKAARFIGLLTIETQPVDARIMIDGQLVAERTLRLDVGDHRLVASAPGFQSSERSVAILGGRKQSTELVLPALEVSASKAAQTLPTQPWLPLTAASTPIDRSPGLAERWWFWTAIGVVLVGGAITTWAVVEHHRGSGDAGTTGVTLHAL